jgi:hypothetical protein
MSEVSAVACGQGHSLFLKNDGSVWASGPNDCGQLGDGTTTNKSTPVQVMSGASAIACGADYSLFLKNDGSVWGSGLNDYGQLGDWTRESSAVPALLESFGSSVFSGAITGAGALEFSQRTGAGDRKVIVATVGGKGGSQNAFQMTTSSNHVVIASDAAAMDAYLAAATP